MSGKLLGHRNVQTTARYAHLARNWVKAAAEHISDSMAADLDQPLGVSGAAFPPPPQAPPKAEPVAGPAVDAVARIGDTPGDERQGSGTVDLERAMKLESRCSGIRFVWHSRNHSSGDTGNFLFTYGGSTPAQSPERI